MVISIIFAYFLADKFTKPIKELSKIAEEMSELILMLNIQEKHKMK